MPAHHDRPSESLEERVLEFRLRTVTEGAHSRRLK